MLRGGEAEPFSVGLAYYNKLENQPKKSEVVEEFPMITGIVKWFNNAKGYGFVQPDGRDEDVFVHFSSIDMDGYKTLKEGQKVQFEVSQGPKGLHAATVQRAMQ